MAEGIFARMIEDANSHQKVACDSAGTNSYHIGELPDERMRRTALKHSIKLTHRARSFEEKDWDAFDYILVMDNQNYREVLKKKTIGARATLHLMREFDAAEKGAEVPDPWYGDLNGFETCYSILHRSCFEFFQYLKLKHQWD